MRIGAKMPNESITTYLAASSQTRYYKQMKCYSESPSDTGIHMDNKQAADQPADPTYLGNKGDGHASKCTQCIPAHKHLTVCAGNTVTAGAGVPAPCIMCLCCRGLSVSFQLLNRWNDEASFSDLFSRQIMSKGSVCTFKYLYTKEYIYICVDKTKKIF